MLRLEELLKYIDRTSLGIEVAPYFNPALPKANGNNVLVLDVFDTIALHGYAEKDPNIEKSRLLDIEEVDIVGDASSIGQMLAEKGFSGKIGYVVSSHNFEHLPNPIKFLRGCSAALMPGGVISMAVPDHRACLDHFRTPTRLSDWLAAFHGDVTQPSATTILDYNINRSDFILGGERHPSCRIEIDDPAQFSLANDLTNVYTDYLNHLNSPFSYSDVHCTAMFPETLELMLRDLLHLRLIDLEVIEISPTRGHEFFVHLRKPTLGSTGTTDNSPNYQNTREALLRRINQNLGAAPFIARPFAGGLFKKLLANIVGRHRYDKLHNANRDRHARRRAAKASSKL